jgi:CopG-like RHH_1 or ribbon-helix-helix domain, RHH_5
MTRITVSLPEDVFERAQRLAQRCGRPVAGGRDPESGGLVSLFDPRRQRWPEHLAGILAFSGAVGGLHVRMKPAKLKFVLPQDVFETVLDDSPILIETIWRPSGPQATAGSPKNKEAEPAAMPGVWDQEPPPG